MRPKLLAFAASVLVVAAACGGLSTGSSSSSGSCVNIDPASYDTSCSQDSDCIDLALGQLCPGECLCTGTPVNKSGLTRWQSATSGLRFGACFCPAEMLPRCVSSVCTHPSADAGSCVTIDPSMFSRACNQDADCVSVSVGQICSGSCLCGGGGAISRSDQARYDALLAGISTEACPCPAPPPVRCVQQVCTQCTYGPNQPPGCADGG